MKIDHIGIAVKSLADSNKIFEKILGSHPYKTETVETEKVTTSFFKAGDVKIELLEAASEDSVIKKFIEKRGEGIHHIAFEVEDIYREINRLIDEGFQILQE